MVMRPLILSRTRTEDNASNIKTIARRLNQFDEHMSTGKVASAVRSLTEEAKGGVRFLTEKVDMKTVLTLRKKHLQPI